MPDGGQRPPPPPPSRVQSYNTPIVTDADLAKDSRSIEQLRREKTHIDEIIAAKIAVGEDQGADA